MTAPTIGWPTSITVDGITDAAILDPARLLAIEVLWALSGRRYGLREMTVAPCHSADGDVWGDDDAGAVDGIFAVGAICRRHYKPGRSSCGCSSFPQIRLPRRPVTTVSEVTIDGVVLDPSAYRLSRPNWLERIDGEPWPRCEDDEDSFTVTFQWGRPVPDGGVLAVERLAGEVAKALCGEDCDLPARVTAITRQNVSMTILDPQDFLNEGRTGLYEVDLWLNARNPHRLTRRSRVIRADARPLGRRV